MAESNELDYQLESDLRDLGGRLLLEPAPPEPEAMAATVRARVAEAPTPANRGRPAWLRRRWPRGFAITGGASGAASQGGHAVVGEASAAPSTGRLGWLRRRWVRRLAIATVALCTGAALVAFSPQVRDGVTTLLRFAGIEIGRSTQPPPPRELPSKRPLPGERVVGLAEASRLATFQVHVPSRLGTPERVLVADGTPPRVVSLAYAGPVRLDEFDGTLDFAYFKKVWRTSPLEWTDVGGQTALWVEGPHAVGYVGSDGTFQIEEARLAANTLIWQVGGTTLRLEGDFTRAEAIDIAESTGK